MLTSACSAVSSSACVFASAAKQTPAGKRSALRLTRMERNSTLQSPREGLMILEDIAHPRARVAFSRRGRRRRGCSAQAETTAHRFATLDRDRVRLLDPQIRILEQQNVRARAQGE